MKPSISRRSSSRAMLLTLVSILIGLFGLLLIFAGGKAMGYVSPPKQPNDMVSFAAILFLMGIVCLVVGVRWYLFARRMHRR